MAEDPKAGQKPAEPPQKGAQNEGGRKRKRTTLDEATLRALVEGDFTDDDEYQEFAREFLEKKKKRAAQRVQLRKANDDDRFLFYLQCPVCRGHGIYLSQNPAGRKITSGDWFCTYKSARAPWMSEAIWCQECLERGREVSLRVSMARDGRSFRVLGPHRRFLFKIARDGEGEEVRAVKMSGSMEYTAEDAHDDLILAGKRQAAAKAKLEAED